MRKILIILSMQNDFINGKLKIKNAKKIVPNVAEKIRNFNNGLLYVTLDTNDGWDDSLEIRKKIPQPCCLYMSHGWLLHDDIFNALQETSCKPMYYERNENKDSVISMVRSIREYCEDWEEVEIEVCGIATESYVIALTLSLGILCPNIKITIDSNCCADITEETHKAALTILDLNGVNVIGDTVFDKLSWEHHEEIQNTGHMVVKGE